MGPKLGGEEEEVDSCCLQLFETFLNHCELLASRLFHAKVLWRVRCLVVHWDSMYIFHAFFCRENIILEFPCKYLLLLKLVTVCNVSPVANNFLARLSSTIEVNYCLHICKLNLFSLFVSFRKHCSSSVG